jgi:hypothetical protein
MNYSPNQIFLKLFIEIKNFNRRMHPIYKKICFLNNLLGIKKSLAIKKRFKENKDTLWDLPIQLILKTVQKIMQ